MQPDSPRPMMASWLKLRLVETSLSRAATCSNRVSSIIPKHLQKDDHAGSHFRLRHETLQTYPKTVRQSLQTELSSKRALFPPEKGNPDKIHFLLLQLFTSFMCRVSLLTEILESTRGTRDTREEIKSPDV